MENLCFYECHELILCITLSFSQYVVISDCPCLSLWDLVVRFTDRHDLLQPKEVRSCLFENIFLDLVEPVSLISRYSKKVTPPFLREKKNRCQFAVLVDVNMITRLFFIGDVMMIYREVLL